MFKYAGQCDAKQTIDGQVKGSDRIYLEWQQPPQTMSLNGSGQSGMYKVAYRKYTTSNQWEWVESATTNVKVSKHPSSIADVIIDEIPAKVGAAYGRPLYDKVIFNISLMKDRSEIGFLAPRTAVEPYNISRFNIDFARGIQVYYPELTKSTEYINRCDSKCYFDEALYNLLVKTIKSK